MNIGEQASFNPTRIKFGDSAKSKFQALGTALITPVDVSSLGTFRILFGALMVYEVMRYFYYDRVTRYYVEPDFYFTYEFFPFVTPLPEPLIYWIFIAMGLCALGVALGLYYRASAFLFFLTYTYVFLLDEAQYNNHYYLIVLLSFLLIFVDADRWASVDQKLNPNLGPEVAPFWNLFILRAQIFVVYFYAGLAKLNPDWLTGEPLRTWLGNRSDYPVLGPFFATEWATYAYSYGGLLFDLTIGFLLLWKRTRWLAFSGVLFFNLMNKWLFSIGIFPYLMIVATILFVECDWPRRILRLPKQVLTAAGLPHTAAYRSWVITFVAIYLAIQILVPLRHWLYEGDVAWTEEGHRFSWRMKLRSKHGRIGFTLTDPDKQQPWQIDISQDLTARQGEKMATRPQMILQYAHNLGDRAKLAGIENPIIKADAWVSLNGRPYQQIIDPNVNLVQVRQNLFSHAAWILPFQENTSVPETKSINLVD